MPKIFGIEQIIYMAIMIVIAVVSLIFILKKVKSDKTLIIIIRSFALALLILVTINRISVAIKDNNILHILPSSFCSMSAYILSLSLLIGGKNNIFLHYIFYISFIGGLITFIYPDFIGQNESIFYIPTISGLTYHTVMLFLDIFIVSTGYFTPTIKKAHILPLGLCCAITFGQLLISALGFSDAMYINKPLLEGSPFTWWFTGVLVLILSYTTMLLFDYFLVWRKINHKKKSNNTKTAKDFD